MLSLLASCMEINEHCAPSSNKMLAFIHVPLLITGAIAVFSKQIGVVWWEAGMRNDVTGVAVVVGEGVGFEEAGWNTTGWCAT